MPQGRLQNRLLLTYTYGMETIFNESVSKLPESQKVALESVLEAI